jgi:hypothetical protein
VESGFTSSGVGVYFYHSLALRVKGKRNMRSSQIMLGLFGGLVDIIIVFIKALYMLKCIRLPHFVHFLVRLCASTPSRPK